MSLSRKVERIPAGDVPLPLAAGLVLLLLALFVPMAWRAPAWPTSLPLLSHDPEAVFSAHRSALGSAPPAAAREILEPWSALNEALARRDSRAAALAQPRFARDLARGTLGIASQRISLRARACEALRGARRDDPSGLHRVARRHGLTDPAERLAWCYLRWERLALQPSEDGSVEGLTDTFLRVPAPMARTFARWGLAQGCGDLLGSHGRGASGADPRRCAFFRRELVAMASGMDRGYPTDEALAATDMMLGAQLSEVSDHRAHAEVSVAYQRALERYGRMLERDRSRRLERYALAATQELAGE